MGSRPLRCLCEPCRPCPGNDRVVRTRAILIEVLVNLKSIVVQWVSDPQPNHCVVVGRHPSPCTVPVGTRHQDLLSRTLIADGLDCCVRAGQPLGGALVMWLVHETKDDVWLVF